MWHPAVWTVSTGRPEVLVYLGGRRGAMIYTDQSSDSQIHKIKGRQVLSMQSLSWRSWVSFQISSYDRWQLSDGIAGSPSNSASDHVLPGHLNCSSIQISETIRQWWIQKLWTVQLTLSMWRTSLPAAWAQSTAAAPFHTEWWHNTQQDLAAISYSV